MRGLKGLLLLGAAVVFTSQAQAGLVAPLSSPIADGTTGNAASELARTGAERRLQIVCNRTGVSGVKGVATAFGMIQRTQHNCPYGADGLQLVYPGWYTSFDGSDTVETPLSLKSIYQAQSASVVGGGSGYALGDRIVPTVGANQIAPTLIVQAVSGGAITSIGVVDGGMYNAAPTGTVTQNTTTGSGTGATFLIGTAAFPLGLNIGLEQVWDTQTAFSQSNTLGVQTFYKRGTLSGKNVKLFVESGGLLATDVLPVRIPARTNVGVRLRSIGSNFTNGRSLSTSAGLGEYYAGANYTDYSTGGTFPSTASTSLYGMQPLFILGALPTPRPSFVIVGDSIAFGTTNNSGATDTKDAAGNSGWVERSMAQQVAWSNFSTNGDTLYHWVNGDRPLSIGSIAQGNASHALVTLGINDFAAKSTSAGTYKTQFKYFTDVLRSMGIGQIWCVTITPYVTCAPDCTTLGNQTVTASNTARQTVNAELRVAATAKTGYGCDVVLDVASIVESGTTGKWSVTAAGGGVCSDDGLHPNSTCHATIASTFGASFSNVTMP